jgi:hypothetical protein
MYEALHRLGLEHSAECRKTRREKAEANREYHPVQFSGDHNCSLLGTQKGFGVKGSLRSSSV